MCRKFLLRSKSRARPKTTASRLRPTPESSLAVKNRSFYNSKPQEAALRQPLSFVHQSSYSAFNRFSCHSKCGMGEYHRIQFEFRSTTRRWLDREGEVSQIDADSAAQP